MQRWTGGLALTVHMQRWIGGLALTVHTQRWIGGSDLTVPHAEMDWWIGTHRQRNSSMDKQDLGHGGGGQQMLQMP